MMSALEGGRDNPKSRQKEERLRDSVFGKGEKR